jgi:hypothetical protein
MEIKDLKKRAKEAQKRRGDNLTIESQMKISEGLDIKKSNTLEAGKDFQEFEVLTF